MGGGNINGFVNKTTKIYLSLILVMASVCFIGPIISPYSLLETDISNAFSPPGLSHPLGTDSSGRDILTRLLYGGRVSISVGAAAASAELLIGVTLGIISGYFGKWTDKIVMGIADVFMCVPVIPSILVAGAIMSDLKAEPAIRIVIMSLVIALMGWPYTARMVRSQVLSIKQQDYMMTLDGLGLPMRKKMLHILPNIKAQITVSATLSCASAIMTESSLSLLGLGVSSPYPSWGNMLQSISDKTVLFSMPWVWAPPAICIFLTLLLINAAGDSMKKTSVNNHEV